MTADIVYVDEDDKPISYGSIGEAHRSSAIHRIVRIVLRNTKGEYLLQKRATNKGSWPNTWDHSAGGHVDKGEDYMVAAKRELEEEIGVKGLDLQEIDYYYSEDTPPGYEAAIKRFNKVYLATYDKTPTTLQKEEVSEVKWFKYSEIKDLIRNHPDNVTDGTVKVFTEIIKS